MDARDRLFQIVFDEMYRMARIQGRGSGETLRPTALMNEAYIKLVKSNASFENRQKSFAHAALAMRQIVLNTAEGARAQKRGSGGPKITLQDWDSKDEADITVEDLHEALENLEKMKPRLAQIITLHYFAGFKILELAEVLGISERTIYLELKVAKSWLGEQLNS